MTTIRTTILATAIACILALGVMGAASAEKPDTGIVTNNATWQNYWGVTVPDSQCNTVDIFEQIPGLVPFYGVGPQGLTSIRAPYFIVPGYGPDGCSGNAVAIACASRYFGGVVPAYCPDPT